MKGIELKTFLSRKGVTGRELAQKMQTTPQNISYMLNFAGDLKFSRLKEIAKALRIPTSELLAEDSNLTGELGDIQKLQREIDAKNALICELQAENRQLRSWVDKLLNQSK